MDQSFFRVKLLYGAFGEGKEQIIPIQRRNFQDSGMLLNGLKGGILVAPLSLRLSRFVFPSKNLVVRPITFYMACLMPHGEKVSLVLTTLGFTINMVRLQLTQ